ncbi:hypothetical protein H6S82_22680 [Planktothrix sp. FACHB-1355]|uniref:Uncharacterized protein n=1 Tax=Aerosakkonema funiforme FACHB-1375 TaxID=2949571 RepID=A0A926ZFV8_9CYAN|nr:MULTISPECIES: hypothetical protein [Oscillatoriales]MBD2181265.1 hypothetical protein [Aerosakkonema funiforme FACHB-1375]MBD3561626.1 hypothetical protein [Planktothrix sp. FACHB-1355]
MPIVRIHQIVVLQEYLLLVFHTNSTGWQFRVTNSTGKVFGMQLAYETPDAAERVGRNWIDYRCNFRSQK